MRNPDVHLILDRVAGFVRLDIGGVVGELVSLAEEQVALVAVGQWVGSQESLGIRRLILLVKVDHGTAARLGCGITWLARSRLQDNTVGGDQGGQAKSRGDGGEMHVLCL